MISENMRPKTTNYCTRNVSCSDFKEVTTCIFTQHCRGKRKQMPVQTLRWRESMIFIIVFESVTQSI